MAEIDRKAQEDYGIPQIVLMENAGRSASEVILKDLPLIENERIACFCGKGNNGGDGFVVARYLSNKNPKHITVYVLDEENVKGGAARDNLRIIRKMGLDIRPVEDFLNKAAAVEDLSVAVDAIFGTGFKGGLPEECAALARLLNTSGAKLYALDVPSGLDATTGTVADDCFRACKTVTFGLPKQGFYAGNGPEVCGEIIVKDIGFPKALLEPYI